MVQEMENLSFVEAMHFLAEKFNIPLEKSRFQAVKKDEYLQLNEFALEFFKESLFSARRGQGGAGLPDQARHQPRDHRAVLHGLRAQRLGRPGRAPAAEEGAAGQGGGARPAGQERKRKDLRPFSRPDHVPDLLRDRGHPRFRRPHRRRRRGQVPEFPRFARSTKKATTCSAST